MKPNTRWIPLFAASFLGVFNANYYKLLIITIGVSWMARDHGNNSLLVSLSSLLFFVPYLFFSPLAGKLAKTLLKRKILIFAGIFQFPVYLLGCVGFFQHNLPLVLSCTFLIGTISTLSSPAKYGLIRDIGGNKGISFGTGTLEMLTFFGNITGPVVGALIADHYNFWLFAVILLSVSLTGYIIITLLKVEESEPMENVTETINPIKFLIQSYKWARTMVGMNLIVLGLGCFWMIDAVLQMNLFVHCPNVLLLTNTQMSLVMTIALLGIGLGSFMAGIISGGKVALLLTPIGGTGMALSYLLMIIFSPENLYLFSGLTFFVAFFSGIFMVPLSAYIQAKIEGRKQSDMIAYSNFITFLLLFVASIMFGIIADLLGTEAVFVLLFVAACAVTFLLSWFVPEIREKIKGMKRKK